MRGVHDSVETVNAAAAAIVAAEARVQPSRAQKRRWASFWSFYWCFGSYKHTKRIGHAILMSEPTAQVPLNRTATITLPFIAPPSSPASFFPSDPPSATQSPVGLLSLASLSVHAYSSGVTAPIFLIGPYAHETQPVSPPVFSTFTTEPSTASYTPPPEPVQMTTPSSPEVPFAQLLSSSLAQKRRNSGTNPKYPLSHYDFQPYQYPGSPGGQLKSPGSAVSTSGTSSPFPDKLTNVEAPKIIGYEHFMNYKWGSRLGSGSMTPNGWGSRLGSGALTPNGADPPSQVSLANSQLETNEVVVHRVSFELTGDDIPTAVVREAVLVPDNIQEAGGTKDEDLMTEDEHSPGTQITVKTDNAVVPGRVLDGKAEEWHRTISLDSGKDFDFNNNEGSDKSAINYEWWTNENVASKELGPKKDWTFFPLLQPGRS